MQKTVSRKTASFPPRPSGRGGKGGILMSKHTLIRRAVLEKLESVTGAPVTLLMDFLLS